MTPQEKSGFPDAETVALCERFSLWLRQSGGVRVHGRPLPAGVSHGMDFDRFARYRPGMDLRHVDWALYARSKRLYVRQFVDEGAGVLAIVLDGSGSMALGTPSKWQLARNLAAVLAFAALRELHAVALVVATGGELRTLPPTGGLAFAEAVFAFLGAQVPAGPTDLGGAASAIHGPGVGGDAVFISDFLDPRGADRGVETLARHGFRVDLCRITAPGELDLPPAGSAVFDPEGTGHRVVPSGPARAKLEATIAAHRATLDATARRFGAPIIELSADQPLASALDHYFRAITAAHAPGARP